MSDKIKFMRDKDIDIVNSNVDAIIEKARNREIQIMEPTLSEFKKVRSVILDFIKKEVEDGSIKEFVAASIDNDGICQIHVAAMDLPGSVGLFEIGKHILISGETPID